MGASPEDLTLVVNAACPAVQALKEANETLKSAGAMQIYYLALMNFRQLTAEETTDFVTGYTEMLLRSIKEGK